MRNEFNGITFCDL